MGIFHFVSFKFWLAPCSIENLRMEKYKYRRVSNLNTASSYSRMQCWMRNQKFANLNNYVPGYEVPFIIIYFMINLFLLLHDIESYYFLPF